MQTEFRPCGCDCGQMVSTLDSQGKPRKGFIRFHRAKGPFDEPVDDPIEEED